MRWLERRSLTLTHTQPDCVPSAVPSQKEVTHMSAFADLTRFSVVPRSSSQFTIYQFSNGSKDTTAQYGDNLVYYNWNLGDQQVIDSSGGGRLTSAPAAVLSGTSLYVVARGLNGNIWHLNGGMDWSQLPGGELVSAPAICREKVSNGNIIHVFAVAKNNQLAHSSRDAAATGQWTDWTGSFNGSESIPNLPGGMKSAPAVASPPAGGRIDIVAQGQDNKIYHLFYDRVSNTWAKQWKDLNGISTSAPTLCWAGDFLHVFTRGLDERVWHKYKDGAGWHDPFNYQNEMGWGADAGVPPPTSVTHSSPVAVSVSPSTIDLFIVGGNTAVWHSRWNGSWQPWKMISIFSKSYPAKIA